MSKAKSKIKKDKPQAAAFNLRGGASYLGISAPTLLKLLHDDKAIKFRRVGKRLVIPKAALDAWLEAA
jgi:excisionase family DNA binding protein